MQTTRTGVTRGVTQTDWLESYHTFSFGEYIDPENQGFHSLRVINDDRVAPGKGFRPHSHHNMEIITFVLSGELEHQDNLGHSTVLRAGEVQHMTAGSGITHSEYNPSPTEPVHFLQVWIFPNQKDLPPYYSQKRISPEDKRGRWYPVATPDGREDSLKINQDAMIYAAILQPGKPMQYTPQSGRHLWLHVVCGQLKINGEAYDTGDGVGLENAETLQLEGDCEVLLFDLP